MKNENVNDSEIESLNTFAFFFDRRETHYE